MLEIGWNYLKNFIQSWCLMFKWFKNKFKKKKKPLIEDDLKGKVLASMRYVVGKDEIIYLDFAWDNDTHANANEAFSELFYKINSGDLLDSSMNFIRETCEGEERLGEYLRFYSNMIKLQQADMTLESLEREQEIEETDNEVVVKPTDITPQAFGGNQI